jgi:hypothetical protein
VISSIDFDSLLAGCCTAREVGRQSAHTVGRRLAPLRSIIPDRCHLTFLIVTVRVGRKNEVPDCVPPRLGNAVELPCRRRVGAAAPK